jgi:glycosyltransferase involved in cell wall biosynthesis
VSGAVDRNHFNVRQRSRGPLGLGSTVLVLLTDEVSHLLVRGQLNTLVEDGFVVHVGCRRREPETREPAPFDNGVTVHHLPFVREPSPASDLRALRATIALIRSLRPHIVSASTPKAGLLGMIAAWWCRVPVRVHVMRGLRSETMSGWRRRLYRLTEKVSVRCAHHVLVNSHSLKAVAHSNGVLRRGEGEVLGCGSGNGVDLERFRPDALELQAEARAQLGVTPQSFVVGFVGRLTVDKGIADLVDAMAMLNRDDVRLLLVGPFEDGDPLPLSVRRRIADDPRIVHVEWLDDPRLAYAAMDVLGFASAREGLPNVVLEAQACGVPVVGYAATGTVDAVREGHTGLLVPVGDVTALSESIQLLLDDRDRLGAMGRAAHEWVRSSFDRRVIAQELANKYRSWLSQAGYST